MSKPIFEDVLSVEGRRDRASYFRLLLFLFMAQLAFAWLAVRREEEWAVYALVASCMVTGVMHTLALAQRLRDTGRSGWLVVLLILPLVGFVVLLVMVLQPGQPGTNRFGHDPLHDPLLGRR